MSTLQSIREQLARPRKIKTPNGFEFTIRVLTPLDYIKSGLTDIPNEFFRYIASLQSGQVSNLSKEEEEKSYALFDRYLSVSLERGVIDPPCILKWEKEKEDSHLLWVELPIEDREYLLGCISGRIKVEDEQEPKKPEQPVGNPPSQAQ